MMENKYVLTNVKLNPSNVSKKTKLLKIRETFGVNTDEAKIILEKIDNNLPIMVDDIDANNLIKHGVSYNMESESTAKDKLKRDKEIKEQLIIEEKLYQNALVWYDTLSDEEQKMVEQLGYKKFVLIPKNL